MIVGIDFGTTNSSVAYLTPRGPEIVVNERGERMTPSVVCFRSPREALVGELARSGGLLRPDQTIARVKRRMGNPAPYKIFGRELSPAGVGGLVFAKLRRYAEDFLRETVTQAVVTVPAYFDDAQRHDVLEAAARGGIHVVRLLNEPTAAALAYRPAQVEEGTFIVLDLGGGTFDITVLHSSKGLHQVRATGGSTELGGADFDDLLGEWVLEEVRRSRGVDLGADPVARASVMRGVERVKIDLSSVEESMLLLPYIASGPGGPIHVQTEISRKTFERLAEGLFVKIRDLVRKVLEDARLAPEAIDGVIFAGGSSRMPRFRREMGDLFPRASVRGELNPDEVVALGAAVCAGIMEGRLENVELRDVLPHALGVRDDRGEFVPLVDRGTVYPVTAVKLFTNAREGQKEVTVEVLQRRDDRLVPLGVLEFCAPTAWAQGEAELAVTFAVDASGVLAVAAEDEATGKTGEMTIPSGVLPGAPWEEWEEGDRGELFLGDVTVL